MEIRTEVLIKATPQKIWKLFSHFENYPNWNPFITSLTGEVLAGKRIEVKIEPPESRGMTFKPKVLSRIENQELSWLGRLFVPGLFDGKHIFELRDQGNSTTLFIQREQFKGLLVPLLKKQLENNTRRGFEAMNNILKTLAEQRN